MTGIVIAVLFLIAATRSSKTALGEEPLTSSVRSGAQLDGSSASGAVRYLASRERCRSARRGTTWYRQRQRDWLKLRGVTQTPAGRRAPRSCPDARWLASVAKRRSFAARQVYERWVEQRTLRDFAWRAEGRTWFLAIEQVQRVFPGTSGWLISCSGAESRASHRGYWVGYNGVPYSTWLRDSDTVGGPLQFRYSTFTGMFRRAVDHVYAHGYRVPIFTSYTDAWRSALGQALAGGWARFTHNDNSHWSASWDRGC